ncbi:polysaccharide biosynthesis tyrosine autokinase [Psychromarinibacter sp. C21-152]|uniref:Polysaccharide biosynthesis tyrosine autokinase n=1 Tax=Psychromarinibacter sediminicola TaxID=3033385 RepID=A0AAE3NQJ3_9RHOB|nr:polysaccharide biosynthesis tyrosine autokinase [Psychromarinibacter sediminicola]MDF0601693.1 polysaccharide biosynthesis tyrosine autokinase [Psychromarinibacter sediminicola]
MNRMLSHADVFGRSDSHRPAARRVDPDAIEVRALFRLLVKRWKTILGASVVIAALVYGLVSLQPPSYRATAKILIDMRTAEVVTPQSEVIRSREPSQQTVNGEIAILRSNLLISDVIRTMGFERLAPLDPTPADATEAERMEGLVWAIRENLIVYAEADSYVIVLEFTAGDADLAADLTNTLADRYIAQQVETRRETIGQAASWLEDQLSTLEAKLAESEERISQMRTESIVENGGTLDNAAQQITTLNNQLVAARAERVAAEAELEQLLSILESGGIEEAAAVVSSPAIETLRAEVLELRRQDASWAETVGPQHPRRASILADLERTQADIREEVQNVIAVRRGAVEVARLREESLKEHLVRLEERVVDISRGEIGLRQLERETAAARQTYEALLSRLTETRIQSRAQQSEARLIERATVPGGPAAPRPTLMAALAGSVAFAGLTLFVFFREMTTTTFRSAREIEAETGLPVLATLPLGSFKSLKKALGRIRQAPYSIYAERMRQLRTTLLMRDESVISTSVMLLSSVPGEGKTLTALALAEMAARAQRSTIVVDCDLRRSRLQKSFGWKMERDTGDLIEGRCTLEEAIHVPKDLPFDVLTTARPRPDLADELSNLWLTPTVEQLKEIYDVIIIDGPPLLAVSDAVIVSKAADTRIYVVEYDRTERSEVRDGLSMLEEFQLPVEGMVLNKFASTDSRDYSYG